MARHWLSTGFAREAWHQTFALRLGLGLGDDPFSRLACGFWLLDEGNIQRVLEELRPALNVHPTWRAAQQGIEMALRAASQAISALIEKGAASLRQRHLPVN